MSDKTSMTENVNTPQEIVPYGTNTTPPPTYTPTTGQTHPAYGPPPTGYNPDEKQYPKYNTLSIAAVTVGAAQILFFFIGIGILAIVFGHISLNQIKKTGEQGKGLAYTGLVLGYAGVILTIITIVLLVLPYIQLIGTTYQNL